MLGKPVESRSAVGELGVRGAWWGKLGSRSFQITRYHLKVGNVAA